MNTAFYSGMSATAARMLGDKGQQMTLRKRTPGTYTPGAAVTQTDADHTVTGEDGLTVALDLALEAVHKNRNLFTHG